MMADGFWQEIVSFLLMGAGLIFLVGSMIGMVRLPDFYSRIHASGNSETLGTLLVFLGLAVYNGVSVTSAKILAVSMFVFLGNPIGSHILSKAAYKTGYPVWMKRRPVKRQDPPEDRAGKEAASNANLHG